MEKEALISAMKTSISEVLEKMFFLPLDFSETVNLGELCNSDKDKMMTGKLSFRGPFSGYLLFFIPGDLALSLTAGFLGEDEESVSRDHVTETLKEILNMIAGSTFSAFDDQAVFDLGIPELVRFDEVVRDHSNSGEEIFIAVNTLDNFLGLEMVTCSSD
ncbi:MAG: chemotaxis protein CheX [Deltaproteobacteria bacterium]|nr:chemotaxis protein CheX [Deltaproteobacteria bacterium]